MKTLKFPEINPKIRRFLIFSATVGAGSVLILYDPPIELLIGATVAVGCLMLLLLGAVHLSDLRPAMIRENVRAWREKRKEVAEVQALPVQKKESSGRIGAVLVSLPAAVHDGIGRLKATLLHRDKTFQEIDAKLDSTVRGQDADPVGALPVAPIAGAGVAAGAAPSDPLLDVSMEDLESLNLDDLENGSGVSPSLDISLDNDLPMAPTDDAIVSGILEANSSDLEEFSDLGDIDELDGELAGLDEISLDELDLPDEADLSAEVDGLSPDPVADAVAAAIAPATPVAPPQPPAPVIEEEPEEENMLAFAMGGGDSDALMDLLKTDSKKQRKEDYNSLLRDLKDVKVSADDLVTGLQDTLGILKNPGKKKVKQQ
ncbi:hypothetical protein [Methanofollis ethanolicus]|uniref:hypothetical protein n=1 Tax=Methanofollis ethanolicus TaxID=488124 RepID=UPI00082F2823|nr:hypothetical protein [Methanofollis ethanolicus]